MSLSAGTPADILPLVEAFPKFKDTDKGDKDKGLFLMSLRVAGAAQLTFQTEPVPDGFRAELPSSCSAVAVLICGKAYISLGIGLEQYLNLFFHL